MSEYHVRILQLREDARANGYSLGRSLQGHSIVQAFEAMTKPEIDTDRMRGIYRTFAPVLLEELEGLAEGLKLPFGRAAALFSGYDVPKIAAMGCSALMTRGFYARNYDFAPEFYDGLFTLSQTGQGYATAGYNLQGIGRHDGVNEKGLAAGLHFVSFEGYRTGVSPWISVRMVLESCATVEEAADMLRSIPHAACYNFSIGDAHGSMAIAEASPDQVLIRTGEEAMACVNHYETLTGRNRPSIEHSLRRKRYLESLDPERLTAAEAFDIFKNRQSPLFFTDYDQLFGTLHTFAYSYEDGVVLTSLAQGHPLEFSFWEWVQGKDIEARELTGRIDGQKE